MIKTSIFNIFRKPKAEDLVREALEEYQRQLFNAEAAAAYQTKMVEYYRDGIKRLQKQFSVQ
jgi:cob(I)alamin adenosyltransferase